MWWASKFHHKDIWGLSDKPSLSVKEEATFASYLADYAFSYIVLALYIGFLLTGNFGAISLQAPWAPVLEFLGISAIVLLIREIGRRRAVEYELSVVTQFVGAGVWRWEPKRNRLRLSSAADKLMGRGGNASIETLSEFLQNFCSEDRNDLERRILNAAESDAGFDAEARIQSHGKTPRWVRVQAEAVREHSLPNGVGVITDISAQKRHESQINQMHDELARCVRGEVIGGLSGALVHELKQPLAAILSNAQAAERMLRRSPIDITELTQTIQDIIADDSRAGDVIIHLRSLFRNDDKVWDIWNINDIVSEALKVLNWSLEQRQTKLIFNGASEPLNVRGNRVQLQQVILNLVVNAAEAMSEKLSGERLVKIETYRDGGVVIVAVKDSGSGVPEEIQGRIFDPFFTTKAQGLGLGLSICRSIVSAHRGWLEVTSERDHGATFVVNLPMAQ